LFNAVPHLNCLLLSCFIGFFTSASITYIDCQYKSMLIHLVIDVGPSSSSEGILLDMRMFMSLCTLLHSLRMQLVIASSKTKNNVESMLNM